MHLPYSSFRLAGAIRLGVQSLMLCGTLSLSAQAQSVNQLPTASTGQLLNSGLGLPRPLTTTDDDQPAKPDTLPVRAHLLQAEAGVLASSTDQVPYWLQTNQFGIIPKTGPAGLLIGTAQSDYRYPQSPQRRKLDWGYGVQLVGQGAAESRLLVAEAYGKVRVGVFELWAGRRKQVVGLADSRLSSGSFVWSGNTLPIPRVELAIPEYWPLGFTNGWVSVKGSFSHGWFGRGEYVRDSYLHQKAIYVRLGKPRSLFRVYGAFTHQAQWGGYARFLERDPTSSFEGQLADSFVAYMNVVLPLKTDALKNRAKFTTFDQNRVGDHRGSAEVGLELQLPQGSLFHYQQHFYDLGRKLYNFRNIEDGLYGLRYVSKRPRPLLSEAVLELFNSGNQGVYQFGRYLGGEPEQYFINGQYPEGWSYKGRTIGTPLISQTTDTNPDLPSIPFSGYTLDNQLISGRFGINNYRVWALHTGLSGNLSRWWGYQTKVTFSRNYGTFPAAFPANTNQVSGLVSVTRTLRGAAGSTLLVSVGYDQGKLLRHPNQIGAYVGWRKTWSALSR